MVTVPCYWRRWWMRIAFEEPAIERPTGSMWGRPLGVVGWIGSTRLTVSPSKTFTSIRYSAMQDNGSAPIPPGKSIRSMSIWSQLDLDEIYLHDNPTTLDRSCG